MNRVSSFGADRAAGQGDQQTTGEGSLRLDSPGLLVRQIGSPIGRQSRQRACLIGLGLNKLRRSRTLPNTPQVRGMIRKVRHLVQVREVPET